ncbi:hypothetical protein FCM35_KLT12616 [Carex littledalei]|uniref:RNase H type-1 domain-containing protein n=1 Tax=Carex littledalei TaxID=544730 RepID=A0A833QJ92_9POAL|nr:hypothetical protein FCM35_KLT12616 [Carex littledalei]
MATGEVLVTDQEQVSGEELVPTQYTTSDRVLIPIDRWVVLVDASWEQSKKTGWGAVFYNKEGTLADIRCEQGVAEDPLHAEAIALLSTLQEIEQRMSTDESQRYIIFSDCQVLVKAVTTANADIPSWKATKTIAKCTRLVHQWGDIVRVKHVLRTALAEPHGLANKARRTGMTLHNLPHAMIRQRLKIRNKIDTE